MELARRGKTITIEKSRVRVEYRGWRSLLRRDWESPISEFEAVEISSKTYYADPDHEWFGASLWSSETMVLIEVTLLHRSSRRKNVRLAAMGVTRSYTGREQEPLRKLWTDAARSLSLPAVAERPPWW